MRGMKPAAVSRSLIYGQLRQSRTANVTNNLTAARNDYFEAP
jgi:hypothetical protein